MPNDYSPDRNNDLKSVADPLIEKYHSHLTNCNIYYLFRDTEKKEKGEIVYGEAKRAGEFENFFTGSDFIIAVYRYGWDRYMDSQQHIALMDHLLSHCRQAKDKLDSWKFDKYGNPVWVFQKPDAKMFFDVIQRHGAWNEQTERVFQIAKKHECAETEEDEGEE